MAQEFDFLLEQLTLVGAEFETVVTEGPEYLCFR